MKDDEMQRALEAFAEGEKVRGPSVRDLQDALGLSSSSVALLRFQRLLEAGYIEPLPGSKPNDTRRYRLTRTGRARLRNDVLPEYALPESGGGW